MLCSPAFLQRIGACVSPRRSFSLFSTVLLPSNASLVSRLSFRNHPARVHDTQPQRFPHALLALFFSSSVRPGSQTEVEAALGANSARCSCSAVLLSMP